MKGMKSILPIVINDITYMKIYFAFYVKLLMYKQLPYGRYIAVSQYAWLRKFEYFKKIHGKTQFLLFEKSYKINDIKALHQEMYGVFFNTDCLLNNLHFMIQRQCIYILHRHY